MTNWDERYMSLARHVGGWSKDRSRQVGSVIVGPHNEVRAIGYNGFPRGINDEVEARHLRPAKYEWTEHAERNAIFNAARTGVSTSGCRIYVPWFPCVECARAIVQAGIVELVAYEPDFSDSRWGNGFKTSMELLYEAGVTVRFLAIIPNQENA